MTNLWVRLRQNFMLLLCVLAVALAETLIWVGRRAGGGTDQDAFALVLTRVGESGSRDLLGAIAGSMLVVASTTFSITVAVLALSSSTYTYGPRLVRNFMADRGNQLVLGVFVATFLSSLMVLRSIRVIGDGAVAAGEEEYFVPHLAAASQCCRRCSPPVCWCTSSPHMRLGKAEMAHAPVAIQSYLAIQQVITDHRTFDARTREAVALAVGTVDDCAYRQAAHTGGAAGLSGQEMIAIRRDTVEFDPKLAALLRLARENTQHVGSVQDTT